MGKFGENFSITPVRMYQYEQVCGAAPEKEYPKKFQLNNAEMGAEIKDQGYVGACVACATSTVLEDLFLRTVLDLLDGEEITDEDVKKAEFANKPFSESYTYGTCRGESSWAEGMCTPICLDKLRTQGTVPKAVFDNLDEMPDMKKKVQKFPELADIAKNYRIGSYVQLSLKSAEKDTQIKDALTKTRTPLVCISRRYFGESHCITMVGWNDETNSYIIKNSWGKSYGENGLKEIPKNEIGEVYVVMAKDVVLPFEDVKEEDWFYQAVKNTYMSGIMTGKTETQFGPNDSMTRAEMATIISRLMKTLDDRIALINKMIKIK